MSPQNESGANAVDYPSASHEARNTRLVQAMKAAQKSGDPNARADVYDAFDSAFVIVPMKKLEPFEVLAVRGSNRETALLAFTDMDGFRRWAGGRQQAWTTIRGRDLAALATEHQVSRLFLDPNEAYGGDMSNAELTQLAERAALRTVDRDPERGISRMKVTGDGNLRIIPPPRSAMTLATAIRSAVEGDPAVEGGYLFATTYKPGELSVGLRLSPEFDPDETMRRVHSRLRTVLDRTLDVYLLDDESLTKWASNAVPQSDEDANPD